MKLFQVIAEYMLKKHKYNKKRALINIIISLLNLRKEGFNIEFDSHLLLKGGKK